MIQLFQENTLAITIGCSALLIIFCFARLFQQALKTRTINRYLTEQLSSLKKHEGNQADIQSMSVGGLWKHHWSKFSNTLLSIGEGEDANTWASQDPSAFFTVSSLQLAAGLNLRAMASFPATLSGLGITCTFLGLVIGVNTASVNLNEAMASTEPNLLGMIEPLLSGAGVAFITSLTGLFFSLVYSTITQRNTNKIQTLVNAWNEEIRATWPLINNTAVVALGVNAQKTQIQLIEKLVSDSSKSLENQDAHGDLLAKMTKSIADDLAVAMVRALDQIRSDRQQSDIAMVEEFSKCLNRMTREGRLFLLNTEFRHLRNTKG